MINYIFATLIVAVIFLIIAFILHGEISKIKVLNFVSAAVLCIQIFFVFMFLYTQWIDKTLYLPVNLVFISIHAIICLEIYEAYYESKRK